MADHRSAQLEIDNHYRMESEKILTFAHTYQIETSEKARIYHHSQIKRNNKRSSILKLDTPEGRLTGHSDCFNYLEGEVIKLLSESLFGKETFLQCCSFATLLILFFTPSAPFSLALPDYQSQFMVP